jgi:GTP-binding protein EngB required for normal cell division
LVLATKSDKLSRHEAVQASAAIRRALAERYPAHVPNVTVIPFSATERTGLAEADAILARWLGGQGP